LVAVRLSCGAVVDAGRAFPFACPDARAGSTIAIPNGWLVKRTGDGTIVEFRSVVEAITLVATNWAFASTMGRASPREAIAH
jgi:hypothetical protein